MEKYEARGWAALPVELQLQILHHVDRADLKHMRAVDKHGTAATSILFETTHLTPNTRSFSRAHQVATSALSANVRHVVYHVGIIEAVYSDFEAFANEVAKPRHPSLLAPIDEPTDTSTIVEEMYTCYLQETEAQAEFEFRDETLELRQLAHNFRNLESVSTVLDEYVPFTLPEGYIERRTGLPAVTFYEGKPFAKLFEATAESALTKIHAGALPWSFWTELHWTPRMSVRLACLRALHLGLYNADFIQNSDSRRTLQTLQKFLDACLNVESLSLDFDEIPFDISSKFNECISRTIYKTRFAKLVRLKLRGLITFEDKFVSFLAVHKSNLQSLHLSDLWIVQSPQSDDPVAVAMSVSLTGELYSSTRGSVVSAFQRIHDSCTLDHVVLEGNFTNRFDEAWYVDEAAKSKDCIRTRIESFLCRRGSFPFPAPAEYLRLQEESMLEYIQSATSDSTEVDEAEPYAMMYCDDSWQWCPELIW